MKTAQKFKFIQHPWKRSHTTKGTRVYIKSIYISTTRLFSLYKLNGNFNKNNTRKNDYGQSSIFLGFNSVYLIKTMDGTVATRYVHAPSIQQPWLFFMFKCLGVFEKVFLSGSLNERLQSLRDIQAIQATRAYLTLNKARSTCSSNNCSVSAVWCVCLQYKLIFV